MTVCGWFVWPSPQSRLDQLTVGKQTVNISHSNLDFVTVHWWWASNNGRSYILQNSSGGGQRCWKNISHQEIPWQWQRGEIPANLFNHDKFEFRTCSKLHMLTLEDTPKYSWLMAGEWSSSLKKPTDLKRLQVLVVLIWWCSVLTSCHHQHSTLYTLHGLQSSPNKHQWSLLVVRLTSGKTL